jgi:hypothetical protein
VVLLAGAQIALPNMVLAQSATCTGDLCFEVEVEEDTVAVPDGVTCTYAGDVTVTANRTWTVNGEILRDIDTNRFRYNPATGQAWIRSYKSCTDGRQVNYWRLTNPPPSILIEPAYDRAVGALFKPKPTLSPIYRGVVNLGMWLAVEPPAENPLTVRAQANDVWAEVTATLADTTFDMGNGDDPITCPGIGDPITESAKDEVDPSPVCGYTYTNNEDAPYTITITSRWTFTYELSNGETGTRPDVELVNTFEYDVIEIQTVGASG